MLATVHHRTPQFLKLFTCRMATLLPAILIYLLLAHGTSVAQTTTRPTNTTPSDAQKAFEKMKTLIGSCQGTVMNTSIDSTLRLASSGNAILNEANSAGGRPPNHEITMFYLDGDRLLATHYCDAGNRPRFEGKLSPDGNTIEFSLLDVSGDTQRGVVKRMAFTIIDANKHAVELTFIKPDGKPVDARGEFQRTQ